MPKTVGVLVRELGPVGPDEFLADERDEPLVDASVAVGERDDSAAVEGADFEIVELRLVRRRRLAGVLKAPHPVHVLPSSRG